MKFKYFKLPFIVEDITLIVCALLFSIWWLSLLLLNFLIFCLSSVLLVQFVRKIVVLLYLYFSFGSFLDWFLYFLFSLLLFLTLYSHFLLFLLFLHLETLWVYVHYKRRVGLKHLHVLFLIIAHSLSEFLVNNSVVALHRFTLSDRLLDPFTKLQMLCIRRAIKSELEELLALPELLGL